MLKRRREKQQQMEIVIMEQMVPEDHFLRKVDRAVDFSFIYDLCAPLYCAENGRPAIDPEILFRMLFVGYLYGIKSEARLEEEVNYNIAYKWFCGLDLTQKAPDATTISQNRRRRFRDNNIAEQIFNEILRQCVEKGLVGGGILYTDSTHIKAKANKHKKKQVEVAVTPKAYLAELDAQVDQEREELGKKPFEREDGEHRGGGSAKRMQSTTDPESGQQSREGKPNGFYYSEHRTVDSKRNVIVNVHVEPANINDVTALPEILDEIETRLGTLPRYMGLDAGYHNAGIAHLLERKGIQGVIGYRRHTHKGAHYGKYRFGYDAERDEYICPEKQRLTWKNTTREGYRQYCCESKICKGCARRRECFGASMSRKVVERHVWQGALDRVIAFTKTHRGKRIYGWRKETIERSFAEAKENHGLRYARMLGIANMREQCFLTAAVQNIKRLVASLRRASLYLIPCIFTQMQGFVNGLSGAGIYAAPLFVPSINRPQSAATNPGRLQTTCSPPIPRAARQRKRPGTHTQAAQARHPPPVRRWLRRDSPNPPAWTRAQTHSPPAAAPPSAPMRQTAIERLQRRPARADRYPTSFPRPPAPRAYPERRPLPSPSRRWTAGRNRSCRWRAMCLCARPCRRVRAIPS